MDEFFLIEAQGGEKGNPKVTGMAYSGGKINLSGWRHPVVVDLAGLQMPDPVPLLANHENRTASRVPVLPPRLRCRRKSSGRRPSQRSALSAGG